MKGHQDDPAALETWFAALPALFDGYQQVTRLQPRELEAISAAMAGVQLIFAAWFCESGAPSERVAFNLRAFHWIAAHRAQIDAAIVGAG